MRKSAATSLVCLVLAAFGFNCATNARAPSHATAAVTAPTLDTPVPSKPAPVEQDEGSVAASVELKNEAQAAPVEDSEAPATTLAAGDDAAKDTKMPEPPAPPMAEYSAKKSVAAERSLDPAPMAVHGTGTGGGGLGVGSVAGLMDGAPKGAAVGRSGAAVHMDVARPDVARAEPMAPRSTPPAETRVVAKGGLQGGSKDDVGQRADYLRYLKEQGRRDVHRVDVGQRMLIQARDDFENGLPNAQVTVSANGRDVFKGTTYANGRTQFFPKAAGLTGAEDVQVTVESQGHKQVRNVTLAAGDQELNVVVDAVAQRKAPVVDVMFILDTTGSMGDEIARIQLTLLDVAARIQRLEPGATVRYGLTLYRDHGDAYVTQVKDFTTNVDTFLATLQQVDADGGGDTPEAMSEGLHAAIHGASWTAPGTPNALRLAVLVADAPPHLDYAQGSDYAKEMRVAAERGIKIFPVAASGLDDQGEYIFRQVAHHTMGRFVFITYGGGTSHHVGQFANNNLDDLVVGLVADEMADLMAKPRASVRALAMAR